MMFKSFNSSPQPFETVQMHKKSFSVTLINLILKFSNPKLFLERMKTFLHLNLLSII